MKFSPVFFLFILGISTIFNIADAKTNTKLLIQCIATERGNDYYDVSPQPSAIFGKLSAYAVSNGRVTEPERPVVITPDSDLNTCMFYENRLISGLANVNDWSKAGLSILCKNARIFVKSFDGKIVNFDFPILGTSDPDRDKKCEAIANGLQRAISNI